MADSRLLKRTIGGIIGLLLATIGVGSGTRILRFLMDIANFFDGVDFLLVVLGVFAFILRKLGPSRTSYTW